MNRSLLLITVGLCTLLGSLFVPVSVAHEVTVRFNANGHEALMHTGEAIESTAPIEVSE